MPLIQYGQFESIVESFTRITEASDTRITEAGDIRETENSNAGNLGIAAMVADATRIAFVSQMYVNVNGTWKLTVPYVKYNGSWQEPIIYKKVSGNWKRVY